MSVDLVSPSGESFYFSNSGWWYLLAFAETQGWERPVNAGDAEGEDFFSAEDARALADAIERGMGGGDPAEVGARVSEILTDALVIPSESPQFSDEPIQMPEKVVANWRSFIDFARRTGFTASY